MSHIPYQKKINGKRDRGRSLANSLSVRLVLLVSVIFAIVLLVSFQFLSTRSKNQHTEKSKEYVAYLSDSLSLPIWNMDNILIETICVSFAKNDMVDLLIVMDNRGNLLFQSGNPDHPDLIRHSREIRLKNNVIGSVELGLTPRAYRETIAQTLWIGLFTMGVVVLTLQFSTALLLDRMLKKPLDHLIAHMRNISAGEYSERKKGFSHREFAVILAEFNTMAGRVEEREESLVRINQEVKAKNKELEQVIYVASHDLRSPLVNITGYSKELSNSLTDLRATFQNNDTAEKALEKIAPILDEDIEESLRFIKVSALKMDSLLTGLLKLSRSSRDALKIKTLEMNKVISDVISATEFQIKETGAKVAVADLPPCEGDNVQINQVFSNLLGNALKYHDPQRPLIIKINGQVKGARAVYCVEDNGIGVKPQHQKNIFEIFHRLDPNKREGEGLGLTIIQQVLARLSGEIWVESEFGKGSRFYIALPCQRAPKS